MRRLKNALSKGYKTICEQDHSECKQLLGDYLDDNVKKSKDYTFHELVHFQKEAKSIL